MAAYSTKNTKILMVPGGFVGNELTLTDIVEGRPSIAMIASTAGLKTGDLVRFPADSTGYSEIDGRSFVIGAIVADTSFEILGADTSSTSGLFGAGTNKPEHFTQSDMITLCFATIDFSTELPQAISVATFCDPTATIPSSVVSAGTISFTGYIDIGGNDYNELLAAESDGVARDFEIVLPNNGYLVGRGVVVGMTPTVPIEGASGYNGQLVLDSKIRHIF